jgi:hypothetical protein
MYINLLEMLNIFKDEFSKGFQPQNAKLSEFMSKVRSYRTIKI